MSNLMTSEAIAIRVAEAFGVKYDNLRRYTSVRPNDTWGAIQESTLTDNYEVQVWVTHNDDMITVEYIVVGGKEWRMNEFSFTVLADEATSMRVERFIACGLKAYIAA